MSHIVRHTCHQWNLVKDRIVCAKWNLSEVSVVQVRGIPEASMRPNAKPWPPEIFPKKKREQ